MRSKRHKLSSSLFHFCALCKKHARGVRDDWTRSVPESQQLALRSDALRITFTGDFELIDGVRLECWRDAACTHGIARVLVASHPA
jgi:hypothetical protein